MTRKQQEIDKLTKQLSNTHFVERAPAEVVAKERDRLEDLNVSMAMLEEQFQRLNLLK
jgi:valyl-tRNA synthetase